MNTVLITGCAGLIGSNLAEWIIKHRDGVKVIGVDNLSGGWSENIHDCVQFYDMDVASNDLDAVFEKHKPDVVYHLAAYAAEALSPFIRKYNYQNNVIATANIINCSIRHNVKRLVFTSSMAVYGVAEPPFHEDIKPNPIDPYGIAKYACELDIQVAGEQHGLDWCIIRPHNVYGRKQILNDPYRNFIGICMYKVLADDPITVYGDGLQTRAFSYIDDSLPCLWRAGVDPGCSKQIINLGGIEETTILNAAETVVKIAGRGEIIHLPPRHEVKHAFSTWQKSVDLLGFQHKTSLEDGIRDMWEWAQTQPKRARMIWDSYELDKGLYPQWKPEALKDGYYRKD